MKYYIGIDNGTSGTIGVVNLDGTETHFFKTPIKKEQSYTKKKQNISRVDFHTLYSFLRRLSRKTSCIAVLERPMINPGRWAASMSAMRTLEAEVLILEGLSIPLQYCDSKEWQRVMLPKGVNGPELKTASRDIGCRLFPQHQELIKKHKDADGILIAEWARRSNL